MKPLGYFLLLYGGYLLIHVLAEVKPRVDTDFRYIGYEELLKTQVNSFSHKDIQGSVQLELDMVRNQVLVGGRDCIFRLSMDNMTSLETAMWHSDNMTRLICRSKGLKKEDCHNFIRVLLLHDDKVFVCGTNAFSPECSWRQANDIKTVSKWVSGVAKCPYDPYYNSTALISSDGDLYSGTVMDITARDPAINRIMGPSKYLRTMQHNSMWLNDPNFVSSYEFGHFVYFFFRESAVEYINCGKRVFSRVARLCKADSGGKFLLEDNWTTFLKARINCSLPGQYPFYFDEIQSIFYLEQKNLFYAIFTTPPNSIPGSAICIYNMSALKMSFNGPYKYQENSKSAWMRKDAPTPQRQQCPANTEKTEKRSHFLSQILVDAQKYQLMDIAIQPINIHPMVIGNNERWSHIVVDYVPAKHHHIFSVVFVATETGKIRKLIQLPDGNVTCLVEELTLIPEGKHEMIKNMKILTEKEKLFVATVSRVFSIPLERCDRFETKLQCMNAMDPYCGWDSLYGKCTRAPGKNPHVHYWHQFITSCPKLTHPVHGGWSRWSDWADCQHITGTGDTSCQCRTRLCDDPAPLYGGIQCKGGSVEVTNCTVDGGWTDYSDWSPCSQTCGTATHSRQRWCTNPAPAFGGRGCEGQDTQEEYCMGNPSCLAPMLHGSWSGWASWSDCTSRCNGGIQARRRSCDDPIPDPTADECVGNKQEWRMCNTHMCDVMKKRTYWTPWVQSNHTGDGHFEQRFRFICRASVPTREMIKSSQMKTDVRFCAKDGLNTCHDTGEVRTSIDAFTAVDRMLRKYCKVRRRMFRKYCNCRTLGVFLVCQKCGYSEKKEQRHNKYRKQG